MALNSTTCPRCLGPKPKGSFDCDGCSRLIAEMVGHDRKPAAPAETPPDPASGDPLSLKT
jgi:hypothetical protein